MTTDPRPEHRIAKLLARAGVASRREIERMIAEGRVALDGRVLDTPATLLRSLRGVTVDGVAIEAPAPARLFVYHKPPGLLVTERDPAGRPTIYDRLPSDLPRVVPVGRLDLATEGLLLLTTDGGLKRTLELPATGVERAYRARAYGDITQARLEELIEGVEIDGIRYGPIDANLERRTGANVWIELILTEGKNREVRRVLDHLGLQVSRLIRTRYGPFVLGDLPAGGVGEVRQHDLVAFARSLRDGRPTDARVEAVEPRTATRSTRPPQPQGEPDRPRRARAVPGVGPSPRQAPAEGRARTPRSAAFADRAASRREEEGAPRAVRRPATPERDSAGPRNDRAPRARPPAPSRATDRSGPATVNRAPTFRDRAGTSSADGEQQGSRGATASRGARARPQDRGERATDPARSRMARDRSGPASGGPDRQAERPTPGDRPRRGQAPIRGDAPARPACPGASDRPKPSGPRRPSPGGGPARPPRGRR